MDIHQAAQALGGDVIGSNKILCPGPGHSEENRSLSVTFIGDTFIVHSFAGDDWRQCKDYVRDALAGDGRVLSRITSDAEQRREDQEKKQRALMIWEAASESLPPPVHAYLMKRAISYNGPAFRWRQSCPFGQYQVNCIVALVRNIVTNEPQAIHRTAVDNFGNKMNHLGSKGRLSLGPTKGGAIKLFDGWESGTLAVAEGIESALSIRELPDLKDVPVWSLLSAGGVRAFPPLPGLKRVIIAADNDKSGTGESAANDARLRLTAAGIAVTIIKPSEVGTDLNDEVVRAKYA